MLFCFLLKICAANYKYSGTITVPCPTIENCLACFSNNAVRSCWTCEKDYYPVLIWENERDVIICNKSSVPEISIPTPFPLPTYPPLPTFPSLPTYEPAPTHKPLPTFPSLPTYEPIPTYPPIPTLQTYPPMPTYKPVPTFPSPPTYAPVPTYAPLPTYKPLPTNVEIPTFPNLPTYPPMPTYKPIPTNPSLPTYPPIPTYPAMETKQSEKKITHTDILIYVVLALYAVIIIIQVIILIKYKAQYRKVEGLENEIFQHQPEPINTPRPPSTSSAPGIVNTYSSEINSDPFSVSFEEFQ